MGGGESVGGGGQGLLLRSWQHGFWKGRSFPETVLLKFGKEIWEGRSFPDDLMCGLYFVIQSMVSYCYER